MRFFNTAGPVLAEDHYAIPPLERGNVGEILKLIRDKQYFVLHAPRQTGKTSALIALRDLLNSGQGGGDFRCVNVNVEVGQVARDDTERGLRPILGSLATAALLLGDDFPDRVWSDILSRFGPEAALKELLTRWCLDNPTPLVLLVDEIDSLVGDTLLSVLRQLRAGYEHRPKGFPQSIVLCGVRDIRDYRIRSSSGEVVAGGSPFNVAAKSLRLGDFTRRETRRLMLQHTLETGQRFTPAARKAVWEQTQGQPWLVNALCAGACFDSEAGRDRSRAIGVEEINDAREELILSRRTHLDQLAHKLEEERVRRVVEPILAGGEAEHSMRDLEYVRDLGLIDGGLPPRIANPIYAEVVPRELGDILQSSLDVDAAWYVDAAGVVDLRRLLTAFATFYGRARGALAAALQRVRRGGVAADPAGVPAAHRQRRRAHRAGVRPGARAHGPAGAVAGRGRPALRPVASLRDRVQGAARLRPPELGSHHRARHGADPRLHGEVQRRGRAPGGVRPAGALSRGARGGPAPRRGG